MRAHVPHDADAPPEVVSWTLTKRCGLRCLYCYEAAGRKTPELSTGFIARHLAEFAAFGVKQLIFSGGEPLLRGDVVELVETATRVGLKPVLCTSGSHLTAGLAARLAGAGLSGVQFSLDSADPETNDRLRPGGRSAYAMVREAVGHAQAAGLKVILGVTVTRLNAGQLPALVEVAAEWDVSVVRFSPALPAGRGLDNGGLLLDAGERHRYHETVRALRPGGGESLCRGPHAALDDITSIGGTPEGVVYVALREATGFPTPLGCTAGISLCGISEQGEVYPCPMLPVSCGNLNDASLPEIWRRSEILHALREREHLGGACGSCRFKMVCGGCRANAYGHTGSPFAADPSCWHAAQQA